jgi:hypothetical protein
MEETRRLTRAAYRVATLPHWGALPAQKKPLRTIAIATSIFLLGAWCAVSAK